MLGRLARDGWEEREVLMLLADLQDQRCAVEKHERGEFARKRDPSSTRALR